MNDKMTEKMTERMTEKMTEKMKNSMSSEYFDDPILTITKTEKEVKERMRSTLDEELKTLPEGSVSRKMLNGKQYLYYSNLTGNSADLCTQNYIKKKDIKFAESLIRKKFVEKSLKCLNEEIKTLDWFINSYAPYNPGIIISKMAIDLKTYPDAFKTREATICDWQTEPYEKGEMFADARINFSFLGIEVRSKSESLIASQLEFNKVPYRYEAKLIVGNKSYYPDFTILKPRDGRILYWEHFGMVNDPEYNLKIEGKLTEYKRIGLLPWVDYISTFDDDNGSLNSGMIKKLINSFIL